MASTLNLQQTLLWSASYVHFQPQTIGGDEPALSNANIIKSTILGPPFSWPWNRTETAPIELVVGQSDYTQALPFFGFLEKAWLTLGDETKEIEVKRGLSKSSKKERPERISVQLDDNQGNITFRLMPVPDQTYTLTLCYQDKATLMTSMANRWDPIPDELAYIFNPGFLAMAMLITGDARFPIFNDRFISHLLGAQDGLDETQRNIFIADWTALTRQVARSNMQTQQGVAGRGK